MDISISKREILEYEKLKLISQIAPIEDKLKHFSEKYNQSYSEFEKTILTREEEEIEEEWDDYIEWKGYGKTLNDLNNKLQDLENVKNITIIE